MQSYYIFIYIDSCIDIGMIPKELKDKITSIGNCAGHGAKMYLLSKKIRYNFKSTLLTTLLWNKCKRACLKKI